MKTYKASFEFFVDVPVAGGEIVKLYAGTIHTEFKTDEEMSEQRVIATLENEAVQTFRTRVAFKLCHTGLQVEEHEPIIPSQPDT